MLSFLQYALKYPIKKLLSSIIRTTPIEVAKKSVYYDPQKCVCTVSENIPLKNFWSLNRKGEKLNLQSCYLPDNKLLKIDKKTYNYSNFGGGGPEKSGWVYESLWIQLETFFLFWSLHSWGWQMKLGILSSVPFLSRTVLRFSRIETICRNSGLLSGCQDQHCSIRNFTAGGQLEGIAGLKFWNENSCLSFSFSNSSSEQEH